jgi:glutathionylspermidine synthase
MLHWVSQMNKDIEAINNELGRQYEEDTRVMSNIVNDTIEDKKKIRALAKQVDELKSRNYILEQQLIILQRK